ncbi:MAG TPA: peptidoglycan-binding protein [Desulfotomaculum sp.]|nr:peptidoglycan-binding protein [Desulfotomaculum sp.]
MAPSALASEKLRVHQVVSENTQQVVVRGKVTVPDAKPDVDKILSTDKTAKIKKLEIVPDKVIVEGTLTLQIVYIAFEPAQAVHHMHVQLPFTTFVDVPGARPGMEVQGKVAVEDVSVVRSRDDARQFDVAAVLSVFAKVTEVQEIDVLTQCPAGATCKTEMIKVANVVASKTKQVIVSDEFDVPGEKSSVDKILEVMFSAGVTGKRVLKNKVIVDGTVTVEVLYVALEPDQPVHQLHRTFPFSDFLEVPGAEPEMDVRVDVKVESADVEQFSPDRLRADVVLMLTANLFETRQINVITEVMGAQATMVRLKIDHVVGEDTTQVVLRDTFQTPEPKPDVEKILNTTVDKVEVTETKILKNKVIVRGDVDVQVIYVAGLPDQPVHAMHRKIPFRTFVEIPGAEEGMEVDVRAVVEYITAEYEACHITIELVLKVTAKVIETLQRDVAVEVTVPVTPAPTPPVCVPGEVIRYTIQSGDTFFVLAQRFGTTVEAIRQANPGVNPEQLQVGQVINIPCPPAKG